ncbi:MAG: hypothetical protein ACI8PZ_004262 [Myxococcota bacterium]
MNAIIGRGCAAASLALFCSCAAYAQESAGGGEVSASFTDDLELRFWGKDQRLPGYPDRPVFNYVEQVNRFTMSTNVGKWSFDAQVDEVALFFNRYRLDGDLVVENPVVGQPGERYDVFSPMPGDAYATLEKVRASYETETLSLTIGDAYVAFGRGMALNLNRNVDIDIDTSVQGIKSVWRPGPWDVTVVAGQLNRQQVFQDNPNLSIPGDKRHSLVGVRAERFGLGPANLGAHAVMYNFVTRFDELAEEDRTLEERKPGLVNGYGWEAGARELSTTPDAMVGGLTAELVGVAGIDWYAEGDIYGFPGGTDLPSPLGEDVADKPGYAAYLSAAGYPGKFVVLVEGKRYYAAERVSSLLTPELYEVAVAPTLEYERAVTEDSGAALNSNDMTGARVQVDWAAIPGKLIPYVSTSVFVDNDVGPLNFSDVPETIVHPMVGFEYLNGESAVLFNLGHRMDMRQSTDGIELWAGAPKDLGSDQQTHTDVIIQIPLGGPYYFNSNLAFEYYQWGVNEFQQEDYVESETSFTVGRGSSLALTLFADYTTNPLVTSAGNLLPGLFPEFEDRTKPLYGAVELQVKPSSAVTLKAFVGGYKAGIRCSGGQCRQLPGFEGARMSMVASF